MESDINNADTVTLLDFNGCYNKNNEKESEVINLKKPVALLLSVALAGTHISVFGTDDTAIAAINNEALIESQITQREIKYPDVYTTEYEDAARLLDECKIIMGYPDGTFRPYEKITRAEFAVVISRFLSIAHYAKVSEPKNVFSDVGKEHWAAREIKMVCDKAIFSGYGDKSFRPKDFITYNQAIKVLVEALGYGEAAEKKGGWTDGYMLMAAELGILKEGNNKGDAQITRGESALLLQKALYVKMPNGKTPAESIGENYFYVSPSGDDANPGTEEKPWKTLYKAAQTAIAGSTIILEDGVYNETRVTTFANSGTQDAPITVKARNKHKAIIKYAKTLSKGTKLQIPGLEYINIRDLYFTQEAMGTSSTSDIYVRSASGRHCEITGNKFDNVFEEGIKLVYAHDFLIEDNIIIDSPHEGMDVFASGNIIIRNNVLYNIGRTGFMIKGNTYNTQLYNNYIINDSVEMMDTGIGLGGQSNNYDPFDVAKGTGFENYYSIAYNNVVIAKDKGVIPNGISFISSKGCRAVNNIVIGAINGINVKSSTGLRNGWGWDAPVVSPTVQNNIIVDCENGIKYAVQALGKYVCENNIFFRVASGTSVGGIVADPRFVDMENGDFRLMEGSPAIDAGAEIAPEYVGFRDEVVKLDMTDYAGNPRDGKWDIGIYSAGN